MTRMRACPAVVMIVLAGCVFPAIARPQSVTPTPVPDDLDRRQSAPFRPGPAEAVSSINGFLRTIGQWVASGGGAAERAEGSGYGSGSLEVAAVVRPTANSRLFLDVQGLVGRGPEQALGTLSEVNADADQLEGSRKKLLVQELWLRLAMLDGRVRLSVGKLDAAHYFDRNAFAEDDTAQFLADALLNDPMLKPPPHGPGAALRFSVKDRRYAFGVHALEDFGGDLSGLPYLIAEVGAATSLRCPGAGSGGRGSTAFRRTAIG